MRKRVILSIPSEQIAELLQSLEDRKIFLNDLNRQLVDNNYGNTKLLIALEKVNALIIYIRNK